MEADFTYITPNGKPLRDRAEIERIRSLVIPPAWTDVWISPDPRGHLQATGRDARRREQTSVSPPLAASTRRNEVRPHARFAQALGAIRQRTVGDLRKPGLKRDVRQCRDIPGQDLFQHLDEEGRRQTVGSSEVNEYLRGIAGEDYTPTDFRTWAGTVLAAQLLCETGAIHSPAQGKKNMVSAVDAVARRLGNTKAVCRKCYIHPAVFDAYLDESMVRAMARRGMGVSRNGGAGRRADRLSAAETAVLALLQRRLTKGNRRRVH